MGEPCLISTQDAAYYLMIAYDEHFERWVDQVAAVRPNPVMLVVEHDGRRMIYEDDVFAMRDRLSSLGLYRGEGPADA